MNNLFNKCILLEALIPCSQIETISGELAAAKSDFDRLSAIEMFFINRLNSRGNQGRIILAVELIKKHSGNLKITVIARQLKISQGQLEKSFRKTVGASPKKFACIVRFRKVLTIAHNEKNLTQLGLEAGFFDQAHFIKDFKSFTGFTPERYFMRK
jgi:AraC-like DNA-binding protein